ncbi:UNVERIFIED_CONTAM: hypothetical protein NCL1_40810 [Trichonephila clavipes]
MIIKTLLLFLMPATPITRPQDKNPFINGAFVTIERNSISISRKCGTDSFSTIAENKFKATLKRNSNNENREPVYGVEPKTNCVTQHRRKERENNK